MKKLKLKVFFVIFSLLTIFNLIIFASVTIKNYMDKKNTVSEVLTRMPKTFAFIYKSSDMNTSINITDSDTRKIFLDYTIYTVLLDNNGNYYEIINHTSNEIKEKEIKRIVNNIIKNHNNDLYIGNLFTNKYSYSFTPNNTLVIMDNTKLNNELVNDLLYNSLLLLLCEIVLFIFTYFITGWITDPVKKSFEKQKNFVADASHELKTPLSVMIASADAYFNDKDEKWIKNMKNESERMIKLVTELLDLAKTEEELDIEMHNNNLSQIVESSILTFESLFYDNNIKLKYDITKDIYLVCNENLIIELMSILIGNAIKHSESKGKVIVNLFKKNKQIILEVKNTGDPIKEEDEEKIFERFYKVDSSRNRNNNNYGLGLAIAKNIVQKHNGIIKAHSDKGYTTFKITWNQK